MTSLEQIVLPLEQSRALVEHDIVLDTVLAWKWSPLVDAAVLVPHDKGVREQLQVPASVLAPKESEK